MHSRVQSRVQALPFHRACRLHTLNQHTTAVCEKMPAPEFASTAKVNIP